MSACQLVNQKAPAPAPSSCSSSSITTTTTASSSPYCIQVSRLNICFRPFETEEHMMRRREQALNHRMRAEAIMRFDRKIDAMTPHTTQARSHEPVPPRLCVCVCMHVYVCARVHIREC